MGIIWTIVLGFVIGVFAKFLHPGKENMGFIVTVLLGIGGSFLAGVMGQGLAKGPDLSHRLSLPSCCWSFTASCLGAARANPDLDFVSTIGDW
jgi:uncharacterized membrane protein YeaQ/YmgE (transglycosylase-associated protein family)